MSDLDIFMAPRCGENGHMNKIKALREERGWSMARLAEACHPPTTASQINKLEKGKVRLTVDWMRRLADALECHQLDIMDGGPAMLKPREKALVNLFRGLSEEEQKAFYGAASALAKPSTPDDDDDGEEEIV